PGISRFSSLYLYDFKKDTLRKLGTFHQGLRYRGEMRTDIHPKPGFVENEVFIESAHLGHRMLFKVKF
ncbi:MAG: hypothetical protein RBQ97_09145, partial [Acholeplasma sp.]|nr:hypothetical protein [Acholeplasma sp.]